MDGNGAVEILLGQARLDGDRERLDDFGGVGADHVGADHGLARAIHHQFHQRPLVAPRQRVAHRPEIRGVDVDGTVLRERVLLAQPDADAQDPAVVAEVAMVERGDEPGRIVLVGDADFLRDDIVRGDHAQAGGPVSGRSAAPFFAQMLDWLAEDKDLVALQSKVATDRSMKFLDDVGDPTADPRLQEQALRRKTTWLRTLNVVLPGALIAALGLCVYFVRRAQKRTFLSSIG